MLAAQRVATVLRVLRLATQALLPPMACVVEGPVLAHSSAAETVAIAPLLPLPVRLTSPAGAVVSTLLQLSCPVAKIRMQLELRLPS